MDDNPYTGDEIESAWYRADNLAIDDHNETDASGAHSMVGSRLWVALRALGANHGRMLVTGVDPHEFAQLPRHRVQVWEEDGFGMLVADVPRGRPRTAEFGAGAQEDPVESVVDEPGSLYDIVIFNSHLADVTINHPGLRDHVLQENYVALLTHLTRTVPGGFFAALMPREVLDDPNHAVREAITLLGDVLGTIRLPSGALRNVAGCDNPTDLILIRRRPDGQPPTDQADFLNVAHMLSPDSDLRNHEHLHQHYVQEPAWVLGTIGARPVLGGPPRLTVRPHDQPLADQLSQALRRIVRSARSRNLTRGTGTVLGRRPATPGEQTDAGLGRPSPPV